MPTVDSIVAALKAKGSEKTRVLYARHGIPPDRAWGLSVADIKLAAKTIQGQQTLALALYDTGMMEAMYLAGIVADAAPVEEIWRRRAFCALGQGDVGMEEMLSAITDIGYSGWVIVEQDIFPDPNSLAMSQVWSSDPKSFERAFSGAAQAS